MLKKDITYENLDEEMVTKTFYFRITKSDLIKMDAVFKGGFSGMIEEMIAAEDVEQLIKVIDKFIALAVGERRGDQFVKNEEITGAFMNTNAYDEFFVELATDENAIANFIKGVMPKEFAGQIDQAIIERQKGEKKVETASAPALETPASDTPTS